MRLILRPLRNYRERCMLVSDAYLSSGRVVGSIRYDLSDSLSKFQENPPLLMRKCIEMALRARPSAPEGTGCGDGPAEDRMSVHENRLNDTTAA